MAASQGGLAENLCCARNNVMRRGGLMKRLFGLCVLLVLAPQNGVLAQAAGAMANPDEPMIVYSAAPARRMAPPPRSDLGGGFIEFLYSGGETGEPVQPAARPRRAPAYVVDQPASYGSPR